MSRPLFPGRPRRTRGTLVNSNMWYERASDIETDNIKKAKNQLENFYKISSDFDDALFVGFQKDEVEECRNRLNLKSFDNVISVNQEKVSFGPVSSTPKVKKVARKLQSPQFTDDDPQDNETDDNDSDDKPAEQHTKNDKKNCDDKKKVKKSTRKLEKPSNDGGGETCKQSNQGTTDTNIPTTSKKKDEKKRDGGKRKKKESAGKVGKPPRDVNQVNNELYQRVVNNLDNMMLQNLDNLKDISEEQLRDPRLLEIILQNLKK
ncbi:hypothetical protein HELRODRAFT_176888 [Helobdella robusta]|uniref:Uncharacterized protein n=1 Tax=Helobdella robusta TaxID=6412 RepID=T1FB08_HELRO|nr:hypothetical protein HELRODRAFT_176888 [Helobdella robusta]ESN98421.1 hypothetical protein HELRODRAFT_176888 [Helobdella robusta]